MYQRHHPLRDSSFAHNLRRFQFLGVLRGIPSPDVEPLINSMRAGGLWLFEITVDSPDWQSHIQHRYAHHDVILGAGTIDSLDDAKKVIDAGARFGVSHVYDPDVVQMLLDNDIPAIPNCGNDSNKIRDAWKQGATFIKMYPCFERGNCIKAFKNGPYSQVEFLATGSISAFPDAVSVVREMKSTAVGLAPDKFGYQKGKMDKDAWDTIRKKTAEFISLLHPQAAAAAS